MTPRALTKRLSLIAICLLLVAPFTFAAEPGLRSAGSSNPAASAPQDVALDTLWERFSAVAPLIGAEDTEQALQARSAELGVPTDQLDFWRKMLLHHGRQGLLALNQASAGTMASLQKGSWQLVDRTVNGSSQAQNNWMFNEVVQNSATSSRVRSLMMEASTAPDGTKVNIGTFGTIEQTTVSGAPYGLAASQTGVLQSSSFQLLGMSCPPGMPIPTTITITALWVQQGDVMRTVDFTAEYFDADGAKIPDMTMTDVSLESATELQIASYTGIGMEETQARMSDKVLLTDSMSNIWRKAQNDTSLLDPSRWMLQQQPTDPTPTDPVPTKPAATLNP